MASNLDAIRDIVAEWDALSSLERQMHNIASEFAYDDLHPRYIACLKALLPVVEAAVTYTKSQVDLDPLIKSVDKLLEDKPDAEG